MTFTIPADVSLNELVASGTINAYNANITAINTQGHIPLSLIHSLSPLSGITMPGVAQAESSGGAPKVNWVYAGFNKDADEGMQWGFTMPRDYGVALTLCIPYYMATVTSGNVCWTAQLAAMSDTDATLTAKAFAAVNAATVTVPGTAVTLDVASITMTNADSVAALDKCVLYLYRDVSEDNAAEDANIYEGVYLTYNKIA